MSQPTHFPPRRIRRNTKPLDALKAASILAGILVALILVLWLVVQLLHPKELPPTIVPQPAGSMWESPSPRR